LYQLFWLDRIPPHAAVNETVAAVQTLEPGPQAGFINAVLRNYARQIPETRQLLADLRTRDPAVGWSHPRWLVNRWQTQLSPAELQAFLAWNNAPALVYARVNTLRCDAARLIRAWRDENVDYDFVRHDWIEENSAFLLRHHPPIERLKSFQEGAFYIQDPSTLLPVHLLAPQPGERLLDLCAAPGGKTTLIAQRIDNDGQLVAAENDARRRERLRQNCERLGADVTVVPPEDPRAQGPFDGILVDAPCSNTGVLRRRLDARWRLRAPEIQRAQRLQVDLLCQALNRLRPGGRLVYSTCSVEPEENNAVIEKTLASMPGVEPVSIRLLHPARDQVDGAFAALLLRR
jgi:16S rRNA (cytosine967-C5)-methyltransferase